MHAGVCAGWRTIFSCYLPPLSLPLSFRWIGQRKVLPIAVIISASNLTESKLRHTASETALNLISELCVMLESHSVSKIGPAAGIEALHQH